MTELEKLNAGLEFDFWDEAVDARKQRAMTLCRQLNALPKGDREGRRAVLQELFGSVMPV